MKACLLLLIITFGVLCVPVEGCMRGGVPPVSTGAIIALCVVFSPVILVVGTGYVVKETGKKAVRSIHRKRVTSNIIRKQRNRIIKKIGAKKFDSYLQDLHDRTKTETSPELFTEYGTALFLNNDMIHAHEWLSKAETTFKANPTVEFKTRGSAWFMRGMVNQYLYDFVQAIEDFQEAQKYLTSTRTVTGEGGAEIPQLTVHDAINATGFARMMQALYSFDCRFKSPAEINIQLTDAIKDITTAIETTPDMQGMYFHNRGFSRYHRAYLVPETEVARELELAVLDFDQAINSGNFGTTAEGHSMKSQCLARLGRLDEANDEQTRAIELDDKVFTVELSDEAAMKVPWPLPKDKFKDTKSNHNFQEVSFAMPHYCTHCGELIRKGKGFECWVCNFRCHSQCHPKVAKQDCWEAMKNESVRILHNDTDEEIPLSSHIHHLKATHFHKPTWCDLCSKIVASPFGKQGYRCTDCGAKMHKGCLQLDGAHIVEEN